ncbi:MAG: aminoacyl-tRNA hydrolase [Endomicrobium sp.]|jgi:PTH1 family peptidyl-tRNA hydrolase|nr:aminoacyl-tRNA hydrolase [Endomicrobium sp.]
MIRQIKLFVGLGNPGPKYENTRHNFGFIVLDEIAAANHLEFKIWSNVARVSFYELFNNKVWLLKPVTFMNFSGKVVAFFARYYKINIEEIFIFYDDFSIPIGKYKIKMSGSAGGHNGVDSIIKYLYSKDFPRMKLGIGPLPKFVQMKDFVLSKFLPVDEEKVERVKKKAVDVFEKINKSGIDKTVSNLANEKYNSIFK